eukprot:1652852-Amphidinium_carterae.2
MSWLSFINLSIQDLTALIVAIHKVDASAWLPAHASADTPFRVWLVGTCKVWVSRAHGHADESEA